MTSKEFIEMLEACDAVPKAYSGRGMYGKYCVGLQIDNLAQLFTLGVRMGAEAEVAGFGVHHVEESGIGGAYHDTCGMGYIVYWPRMEWPKESD